MSDLISIAGSAVAAYQRALSTVSNNIANLNTDGYTRQVATFTESAPQATGNSIWLGTGAQITGVERMYSEFVESGLRNSTSELATQTPLLEYANRVINVMGDAQASLVPAMDQFFASARALSADPASTDMRGAFLRSADNMASRFRELSSQLGTVETDTRDAIASDVSKLNELASQLANVNAQLSRQQDVKKQAPDLLDQRDKIMLDMSKLAGLKVTTKSNGEVNVGIGLTSSQGLIVESGTARLIQPKFSDSDVGKVDLVVDPYGEPTTVTSLSSGSLGGLMSFRAQGLEVVQSQLDNIALTTADAVNRVHTSGIDALGRIGEPLFQIDPIFRVESPAGSGAVAVTPNVTDISKFKYHDLELRYDASRRVWTATDLVSGENATGLNNITLNGTRIDLKGIPRDQDTIYLRAVSRPASGIRLLQSDPQKVAAGALFRVASSPTNTGDSTASVSFVAPPAPGTILPGPAAIDRVFVNNPNPSAGVSRSTSGSASLTGVASVPSGYKDVSLMLNTTPTSDVELQVFTRDGRHLLGKPLDSTQQAALMQTGNGFAAGAGYSDQYLNQTGVNAYQQLNLFYGAQAKPTFNAPEPVSVSASLSDFTDLLNVNAGDTAIGQGSIRLNGVELGALIAGPSGININDVADWINARQGDTGVTASVDDPDAPTTLTLSSSKGISIASGSNGLNRPEDLTMMGFPGGVSVAPNAPTANYATLDGMSVPLPLPESNAPVTIANRAVVINGQALGAFTYTKQESDAGMSQARALETWINNYSGTTNVTAAASNRVDVPASALKFGLTSSLNINGTDIGTAFTDPKNLVNTINAKSAATHVIATLNRDNSVTLTNDSGYEGDDITIASVSNATENALGLPDSLIRGHITLTSNSSDGIQVTTGSNGHAADLAKLGLRTGAYVNGPLAEDLLVFASGSGQAAIATGYTAGNIDALSAQRTQKLEVQFNGGGRYTIRDLNTSTVLAERSGYDPTKGITFGSVHMNLSRIPANGDKFEIDGNGDGIGSNDAMQRLVSLEKDRTVAANGKTLAETYNDNVSSIGGLSSQAKIAQAALKVVNTQSQDSRDQVSGVNLDNEAADLIRFQQAYQAAAKSMQVGAQLFDAVLQIR